MIVGAQRATSWDGLGIDARRSTAWPRVRGAVIEHRDFGAVGVPHRRDQDPAAGAVDGGNQQIAYTYAVVRGIGLDNEAIRSVFLSLADLQASIQDFLLAWNQDPQPLSGPPPSNLFKRS